MKTKRSLSSAGVILLVVFFYSAQGMAQVSTHILHSFPVIDGKDPRDGLTLSKDGNTLFGTTQYGWDGNGQACAGTIFKIGTTGGTLTYLHAFGDSDGAFPQGLTLSSDGTILYGVTNPGQGGWPGNGTVFKMNTDGGSVAVLHTFGGSDGKYPQGNLTLGSDGLTLYGMTYAGGTKGGGIIFSYNLSTTAYTILHSFPDGTDDGYFPLGSLTLSGSTLCGMANGLGSYGRGTVFKLDAGGGALTVLHAFGDPGVANDGQYPRGNLTLGGDGATIYGMTPKGGANGTGAIFAVTSPAVIDLVSFTATPSPAKVTLAWQTSAEIDTVGFYLSRSLAQEGPFTRITPLIPSQGFSRQGTDYRYADTDVQSGTTYYYLLEDIDGNGAVSYHGPVSATVTAAPDAGEFCWRPLRQTDDNSPPDSLLYIYCIY